MPKVFSKFDTNVVETKGKSYQIKYMLCNICNTKAMCIKKQPNQKKVMYVYYIYFYMSGVLYVPTC